MSDPFTSVHGGLWAMLESSTSLKSYVKAANRIKLDSRELVKREIASADLPELRVIPDESELDVSFTGNGVRITRTWHIALSSGDYRISQLYPVEWEIVRASFNWSTHLASLTWNSKTFVKDVRFRKLDTVDRSPLNRSINGWVSVLACEVTMVFDTADLPAT